MRSSMSSGPPGAPLAVMRELDVLRTRERGYTLSCVCRVDGWISVGSISQSIDQKIITEDHSHSTQGSTHLDGLRQEGQEGLKGLHAVDRPVRVKPPLLLQLLGRGPAGPLMRRRRLLGLALGAAVVCVVESGVQRERSGQALNSGHPIDRPLPNTTYAGQGGHSSCPPAASCCCTPAAPPTSLHVESSAPGTSLSLFRVAMGCLAGWAWVHPIRPPPSPPSSPQLSNECESTDSTDELLTLLGADRSRARDWRRKTQSARRLPRTPAAAPSAPVGAVAGPVLPLFWGGAPRRGRRLQPGRRPRCPLMIGRSDPACVVFE